MTLQVRKKKETGHFLQCVTCLLPVSYEQGEGPKEEQVLRPSVDFLGQNRPKRRQTDW